MRRRRKRPTQWVTGPATYATSAVLVAAVPKQSFLLVGSPDAATNDPPVINRYTVDAVLGCNEYYTHNTAAQTVDMQVGCGIIVMERKVAVGAEPDPLNPSDADAGWLWLEWQVFPLGDNNNFSNSKPAAVRGNHWKIRSKRVMTENHGLYLIYSIKNNAGGAIGATDGVRYIPYWRTLISRVA